ncbi:MAG: kelch repeat-containing protein [Planctomycetota bacterium]
MVKLTNMGIIIHMVLFLIIIAFTYISCSNNMPVSATDLKLSDKAVSSSQNSYSKYSNDTALSWTLVPSDNKPSPRFGHAMTYDSTRNKIVLFGGSELNNETWEREGTQWILKSPTHKPSPRYVHSMVYDSDRGKVVLFGGLSENSINSYELIHSDETWEWDGTDWTLKTPVHKPSGRRAMAMAYDSGRHKTVLFGGETETSISDETWEWDGTDWTLKTPVYKPSAQWGTAMAYDSKRDRILFYRGFAYTNELWSWDGTDWTLIKSPANGSQKCCLHTMTYDTVRDRMVELTQDEVWEYDGANWIQQSTENRPSLYAHTLVYDSVRRKVVIFGGIAGCYPTNDTWEWGY